MKENKHLVGYIRKHLRSSKSHYELREHLVLHGWKHHEIHHHTRIAKRIVAREKKIMFSSLIIILVFFLLGISLKFGATGITGYQIFESTADDKSPYIAYLNDVSMTEAHEYSFIVEAGDTDGENLNFTLTQDSPSWASIETTDSTTGAGNATGNLTLTPPDGTITTETVVVVVYSISNDTDSRSFEVTVNDNNAPTFSGPIPNESWAEDSNNTNINLSAYFTDAENDSLTYIELVSPENITVTITDGIVELTPDPNYYGITNVSFTADDGIDTTNTNLIYLNVSPIQDAPEIVSANISPESAYINSNLSCSFYVIEHDLENSTANITWYKYNTTSASWDFQQGEEISNCGYSDYCYSVNNISYSQTDYSETWNCSVFLNDSIDISTIATDVVTVENAPPFITNISDNSNETTIMSTGDSLLIDITWSDIDNDNATLYVCSTDEINISSGCVGTEMCSFYNQSTSPVLCNYTITGTSEFQNNYSVFGCNNISCSGPYNESYFTNRPPMINRSSITLSLQESRIGCSGACESNADNQQVFLKFNNSVTISPDIVALENVSLNIVVSSISGNWSGQVVVYGLNTNTTTWNSSSSAAVLSSIPIQSTSTLIGINETTSYPLNVTTAAAYFYPDETYFEFKLVNPESDIAALDNASSVVSAFPIGNVISITDAGELQFGVSPTLLVEYNHSIPNQSWYMNVPAPTIDLDDYFYDAEGDAINFTVAENPAHISITINDISHVVSFLGTYGWYGTESVIFNATDERGGVASSNSVPLTVLYVEGIGEQQTTTTSSSSGGGSTEVASLDILLEGVSAEPTDVIIIPFTLRNSGAVDLAGINLSTFHNVKGLMTLFDEDSFVRGLAVGENYNSTLTLVTKDVKLGNYSIEFIADVDSPNLVQTSTIYVHVGVAERANESIEKQIEFTEDLFKTNPECLELMESVFRAKGLVEQGRISEARRLMDAAIEDCRELISKRDIEQVDLRKILSDNWEILFLIITTLFIIYLAIIILFKY